MFVGTSEGVFRVQSVRRKPEQERYQWSELESMVGLPWKPIPSAEELTEVPPSLVVIPASTDDSTPVLPPIEKEVVPRQVYIQKTDLLKYGYSRGCDGCKAARSGSKAIAHSPQCRARIEGEMKKDESQNLKLERTDKRMVKTIVEREEKRRRVGDAVAEKRTDASNDNKSEGSKMDISVPGSQQTQVPDVGILKHDDNEETSERPNKKVRF